MRKVKIQVIGRVQGVGFRYVTKQLADDMEVKGTVRNESDGSVYIEAAGTNERIEQFITALENNPTPFSKVNNVIVTDDAKLDNFVSFKITN
ncbi:acylphosphatase [Jeotgalibaca ciconiae]|uniref:acylphosphatase n=1 Tax=Jeotgalibaca ciconiae TaxID=2496265 RepID=A0A3Q9BLQ0_9LACT|nr:acylphosphatase [Jeotgalibaca ciconiae]AZP05267.1 acylphosphatase [Jeotgalibaca ciconiae]HJB23536.1 acylphosphatase [Candidatus Jeotgalibaca pullicola]